MHPLRLLGWGLLAAAFFAAAMEVAAQGLTHDWGWMAASDVLLVLAPDFFVTLRDAVDEYFHPLVWDYVALPLLQLPGWLLLGVPGAALVWIFRPPEEKDESGMDSLPHASYEEIVAAAREADEDDIGLPSKYRDLEEYDPARQGSEEDTDQDSYDTLAARAPESADMVPPAGHIPPPDERGGSPDHSESDNGELRPPSSGARTGAINRPF